MAAVCAVGQIDHGGNTDGAVLFGHLHVEQPFKGSLFSAVHLSQTGCQSVKLIEIAFMGQMVLQEDKAMVFEEFPSRLFAQRHLKLVQRIQKAVVGSRKLQLAPPVRLLPEQLHTKHFIQGSSLPSSFHAPYHSPRPGDKAHSFCRNSSPHRTRCAGLRRGPRFVHSLPGTWRGQRRGHPSRTYCPPPWPAAEWG